MPRTQSSPSSYDRTMDSGSLTTVAVYRRQLSVSLDRVWENVLDWEHLPWLHKRSFVDIERIDSGAWGWRARVGMAAGSQRRQAIIEIEIDRPACRYVARTVEGSGQGAEIWTQLDFQGEQRTDIEVEFCLPEVAPERVGKAGEGYTRLYTRLWDEDESMMLRRQAQLDLDRPRGRLRAAREPVGLGPVAALRARLPLAVELDGRSVRIVESQGALVAHSTVCPHLLGPLDAELPRDGRLRCPWHGYTFDLQSGKGCAGNRLQLAPAPRVEVDPITSLARLVWSEDRPTR